ncbi:hypothetical protein HGRIS_000135 [Hohenbuehelia grisea]|uniref:Cytochrome P450 n=1 Tax=Hohenbuehelia grisea TaxID=104357 RepID=A0ABR3JQS2_9AGAR
MVTSTLVKAALAYVFTIGLWRLYKAFLAKKPFDNLRGPKPQSWITGNHLQIFGARGWDFHRDISATYGGAVPVWNILGAKQLYVFDPTALNVVFLRDQDFYERSPLLIGIGYLILGNGLLNSSGETHRRQRKMMTPVFSTAHLRHMVPFFYDVMNRLQATFEKKLRRDGAQEFEMLQWMSRAALELIGRGGLGVSFDPLTEEAEMHTYSKIIKELIPTITPFQAIGYLIFPWGMQFSTPEFRRKVIDFICMFWPRLKKSRDMIDLMYATSTKIYDDKQKAIREGDEAVANQLSRGKDIMGILLKNNHEAAPEDKLPEDEIIAQMSSVFILLCYLFCRI